MSASDAIFLVVIFLLLGLSDGLLRSGTGSAPGLATCAAAWALLWWWIATG
jgi:hypothetical protein